MRDVPDCLNRRYKALDDLIQELSTVVSSQNSDGHTDVSNDPSIKLMCEFWNILKEDPDCNLTQEVKHRMGLSKTNSLVFGPHHVTCYMAKKTCGSSSKKCCHKCQNKPKPSNESTSQCKGKEMKECCKKHSATCSKSGSEKDDVKSFSEYTSLAPAPATVRTVPRHDCGHGPPVKTESSPLTKALCNLKQAASHDKACNNKIQDLLQNQSQLKEQIQRLEERENQGLQMLKKADCMWTCMEDCYKKKLEDSQKRQKDLLKELKKVEQNNNKWRKNNKDLELQMSNLNKICQEMGDKINQKKNDIKVIDTDIENLKKRVDNYTSETDSIKKSIENRQKASNLKVTSYGVEVSKLQNLLSAERKAKINKETEGAKYIKEARNDLQQICKVLLQKRLRNEDLRADKKALEEDIELLKQTLDHCKDKCSLKQKRMKDEIKKVSDEIANYKLKCIRCHQCTDTSDIRKLCMDCPKCLKDRECKVEGGYCVEDSSMDCVCQSVKQKFLDNVFENMYTVLARQSKTGPGKAVADLILKCLKKSTNGKLNDETRKVVQEFILTTVKKNLNLTIVGGAVKTRCEMDSETYNLLMSCLKDVEAVKPPKEDKGTGAKKASCRRWGGTNECNCPRGPKACVCTRKAPPPLDEPCSNPPMDADDPGEVVKCPHKESTSCGVDCAMHGASNVDTEWKRDPCKSPTSCSKFSNNMRAAQCVLGPESLLNMEKRYTAPPVVPPSFEEAILSNYDNKPKMPCACGQDHNGRPRQRIIEEVIGKYTEMPPIAKVTSIDYSNRTKEVKNKKCLCENILKEKILSGMSKHLKKCNCGSDWIVLDSAEALKQMLMQKRATHVCRTIKQDSSKKIKNKNRSNDFNVILHPIFSPRGNIIKKNKSSSFNDNPKSKYRKTHISKIAKDLMTDVIVSDVNRQEYGADSNVKWMTIDALIKQISSDTNSFIDDVSTDSVDETEMDCGSLEDRVLIKY